MVDKQFGGRSGDERAGGAAVEHEAGDELGTEDARLRDELQRLAGGPAIEWRGLRRDQDEIGREQGRARQAGNARRAVDNDMAGVSRELGRLVSCIIRARRSSMC